jgi:hypothetical protein
MTQQLWVADLQTNAWTKLQDSFWQGTYRPFAIDGDLRRVITVGDGYLGALSLDPATSLASTLFTMNGDLGPMNATDAVVLSNGKLLATAGQQFRIFDPAAAAPRWETFGKPRPADVAWTPAFTEDPTSGEILFFGGAQQNYSNPPTSDLYALAKDGSTFTKISIAAPAPPARSGHGAIVAGHALVIVGGESMSSSTTPATPLDDVWTLDRAAANGTWKKSATLPASLLRVTLHAISPTEVWALGWHSTSTTPGSDATLAPIVAIDLATGNTRELANHGAPGPTRLWSVAPLGSCFVGFESGDTVDGTQPNLWRCKKDGDGLVWESTPLDADDYALGGLISLRGASTPDASRAFFIGPTLWSTPAVK